MKTLVVPTCREFSLHKFLQAWGIDPDKPGPVDSVFIVFDGVAPPSIKELTRPNFVILDWTTMTEEEGAVYSRQDSSIRSYGFMEAYRDQLANLVENRPMDDLEDSVILTLDDDCYPDSTFGEWVKGHVCNLGLDPEIPVEKWTTSVPHQRVRGLPYFNKGTIRPAFSMGLWTGVPDFDAPASLQWPDERWLSGDLPSQQFYAPSGIFFPFCGMNFAFRSSFIAAAFMAPMGFGTPYHRFDDIWMGLLVQKVCWKLQLPIVVGHPLVHHSKASNSMVNLVKEAPGIAYNEKLWEMIDSAVLTGDTPGKCMRELCRVLRCQDEYCKLWSARLDGWLNFLGN